MLFYHKCKDGYAITMQGQTVVIGNGGTEDSFIANHCDNNIPDSIIKKIKAAGKNPIDYAWCCNRIVRAIFAPEINRRASIVKKWRERKWDRIKKAEQAADAPYIAKMEAQERDMVSKIPDGAIRVEAEHNSGSLDGLGSTRYSINGIALSYNDVTVVGHAVAIRDGAKGAFDTRVVAYTTQDKIDAAKKMNDENIKKIDESKKAERKNETHGIVGFTAPCPHCGTYCCGDCDATGNVEKNERRIALAEQIMDDGE